MQTTISRQSAPAEGTNGGVFKSMMTATETANYMGISKSYLYKMTAKREIPCYKPHGKMVYFDKTEVDAWMRQGKRCSNAELDEQAAAYCRKGGEL